MMRKWMLARVEVVVESAVDAILALPATVVTYLLVSLTAAPGWARVTAAIIVFEVRVNDFEADPVTPTGVLR